VTFEDNNIMTNQPINFIYGCLAGFILIPFLILAVSLAKRNNPNKPSFVPSEKYFWKKSASKIIFFGFFKPLHTLSLERGNYPFLPVFRVISGNFWVIPYPFSVKITRFARFAHITYIQHYFYVNLIKFYITLS